MLSGVPVLAAEAVHLVPTWKVVPLLKVKALVLLSNLSSGVCNFTRNSSF